MLDYDKSTWTLIQENSDYVDFECYVEEEDPGPYLRVVLTLCITDVAAYVIVESGNYNGSWNDPEEVGLVSLSYDDAVLALKDKTAPIRFVHMPRSMV